MDSQWVDCSSTSRNGTKNENWDIKTEKTHSSYVSIWPKASEGIGIPGNGPWWERNNGSNDDDDYGTDDNYGGYKS